MSKKITMAVLGVQIVLTMTLASVMSKISPYKSLSRWLLTSTGLVRYVHPSDGEILAAAGQARRSANAGGRGGGKKKGSGGAPNSGAAAAAAADDEPFSVPRNIDVQLETTRVTVTDVSQLRFFHEYQWLVDFAVYALLAYSITELYAYSFPSRAKEEVNLSMVWCLLAVGFAYKMLFSLTGLFFEGGDESQGERSLVICMGAAYLFFAMLVLIVHEDTLETGLDEAYATFNKSAAMFLENNDGLDSSGPASKLVLKFFLAVWCGTIGALFTFPGLRLARMQWDVLRYTDHGGLTYVALNTAFVSPLLLATLWIRPLSREVLAMRIHKGMETPLLTEAQFESLRLILVLLVILLRLAMMPRYLQSYLNVAYHKMEELKQEAGKISNIELQRTVARVFYYLCVVTLQYVAPMVLILYLSLMYKTMGGGSWDGLWAEPPASEEGAIASSSSAAAAATSAADGDEAEEVSEEEAYRAQFSLAWQSLKQVFTPSVFRGLLGFSTWWCCLVSFLSSAIGMAYQSYFGTV